MPLAFARWLAQICRRYCVPTTGLKSPILTDLWDSRLSSSTPRCGHFSATISSSATTTDALLPCVGVNCGDASEFWPQILPGTGPLSLFPHALLSLPFLLLFRLTCYYYRGAYYRSVWRSLTACAVAEPHATYTGETRFPLILQNLHRYFFYIAAIISVINTWDAIQAMHSPTGFGFGLGNVIPVGERHSAVDLHDLVPLLPACDGRPSQALLKHPVRYWMWSKISQLNVHHKKFAWITLGTLMFTDFYIMLVASSTISRPELIG